MISLKFRQMALLLICFMLLAPLPVLAQKPLYNEIAFYYGDNPPLTQLKYYKNIVIDPGSGIDPKQLMVSDRTVFAYVSLGEALNLNQYGKPLDKSWVIGQNSSWSSLVIDQANPAWQAFFLQQVITPLWDKGYRGFFLDTLDSYRLVIQAPEQVKKQQEGLIAIIHAIKKKYPTAKLLINRGFELLPQIKTDVHGLVAESLFYSWNSQKKLYVTVSEKDRNYLLNQLLNVKRMGIPITIIDYLPPAEANKAIPLANKIQALGFTPWITDKDVRAFYLYHPDLTALPRKILLFYQGKPGDVDEKMGSTSSRAIAMPLNHLGYVTELRNVEDPLPKNISANEYAGIVITIEGYLWGREDEIYHWYLEQMKKKIPLVILNQFGFPLDNQRLAPFFLSTPSFNFSPRKLNISYAAPMIGYENSPVFNPDYMTYVRLLKGKSLLKITDEAGMTSDISAITAWGGYFLTNTFLVQVTGDHDRWAIDPFQFFKEALHLTPRPIPDTTTENGRRLMFVHIDGDGFANKGEYYKGRFVGEIMQKEFLEPYAIPTTVSIVQGEIASNGLYPNLSPQLEAIARNLFALPYVEIGSHSYSHPFIWTKAAAYKGNKPNPFTLRIPNYRFNIETEIKGSVDYINDRLAPAGKKCKMFLWCGEGNVPEKALELTYQIGIGNINPGKLINNYANSMVRISPLGLTEGPYWQVFAPIGNDNETLGRSPYFYSFIEIIDALKLTDKPRRLKPIDIYTHFYSVQQPGGVKALHQVYRWALAQPVHNIFASDYFNKVIDFTRLTIAKQKEGWFIVSKGELRELRISRAEGYPDLIHSTNVIGYSHYNDDCYIHLGPEEQSFVRLSAKPATIPFLKDANARVSRFVRTNNGLRFSLDGYVPAKFTLANVDSCTLWLGQEKITPQIEQGGVKSYEFKQGLHYDFTLQCG